MFKMLIIILFWIVCSGAILYLLRDRSKQPTSLAFHIALILFGPFTIVALLILLLWWRYQEYDGDRRMVE